MLINIFEIFGSSDEANKDSSFAEAQEEESEARIYEIRIALT